MSLLVYVTEACRVNAAQHGLEADIERFTARVEESQSTSLFDHFPPPYLVKKNLGGRQWRLIADHRTVQGHGVIRCLCIMVRGSREYKLFVDNPGHYGSTRFDDVTDDSNLEQFVSERTQGVSTPSKPSASDEEYGFLFGVFGHQEDDLGSDLVFETEEWLSHVSADRISKQLAVLCEPCRDALALESGLNRVPVPDRSGWWVWAFREPGRLLLLSLSSEDNGEKAEEYARKVTEELSAEGTESLLRVSRRAYPALILADDEFWIDLERDALANFALSPEETSVLESARSPERPFPLFINGRAGSGKSTILQYLFADLLAHYLRTFNESSSLAPPIYLTANPDLLERARDLVSRILRRGSRTALAIPQQQLKDLEARSEEAFRQFQPYLLSLLLEGAERERFAVAKHVDFSRFCLLWQERFRHERGAQQRYGPELSWHVIRSYIKGMSSETYLEPEDYLQLPENQISVTKNAYQDVYTRVWLNWYKPLLEENGYWDDQDLTRRVLDLGLASPKHLGVVCDEAQDFTRIELELLLRINVFSNRALEPTTVPRVPFAFAGDQFQTLNPTGFQWDAIKASFVEKFVFELNPLQRTGPVDLNYRELQYNYRSTDKIVRFCNYVQATRAALFRLPDVKPQKSWAIRMQPSLPVVWFRANDASFWSAFADHGNYVVLVPCAEGEERTFVDNDPVLREHIHIDDGVPVNILSASRAKGNEYQDVVVYGFGESIDDDLGTVLSDKLDTLVDDRDRYLPAQYFFNRLYVAVSRAKERLIVVDTETGFRRLWKSTQDEAEGLALLNRVKHGEDVWANEVEGMLPGTPANVREGAADALVNARAFEADGRARRDSFLLKQAAQAYRNGGDQAKFRECKARALEADEAWLEAGVAFLDAGLASPDAVRCLWRAQKAGWNRLLLASDDYPELSDNIEHAWSLALVRKECEFDALKLLSCFADRLDDSSWRDVHLAGHAWAVATGRLLERLFEREAKKDTPWTQLVAVLERIRASGVEVPPGPAASVYYEAEQFEMAVESWDRTDKPKPSEYQRASALTKAYPDRVLALGRLQLYPDIRVAYEMQPDVPLSHEQADVVVEAYLQLQEVIKAYETAWKHGTSGAIALVAAVATKSGKASVAKAAMNACVIRLVDDEEWKILARFASTAKLIPIKEWEDEECVRAVSDSLASLQMSLIRALARSEALPQAERNILQSVSRFLKKRVRVSDRRWTRQVSVLEVGAAFERLGRFVDALEFYEAMRNVAVSESERSAIQLRWIATKGRQLNHSLRPGKDTAQVRDMRRSIKGALEKEGIRSASELDKFPSLEPLEQPSVSEQRITADPEPQVPSPQHGNTRPIDSEMTIGPFRVQLSRRNGRCNITHRDTLEVSVIRFEKRSCGGELEWIEVQAGQWTCEQWGIDVKIPAPHDVPATLDIGFREYAAEMRLRL